MQEHHHDHTPYILSTTEHAWLAPGDTQAVLLATSSSARADMRLGFPRMRLPNQDQSSMVTVNPAGSARPLGICSASDVDLSFFDGAAPVVSVGVSGAFAAMASSLVATDCERLVLVSQVVSSAQIRSLNCRAVTSDHNTSAFKRRRQATSKELSEATGLDIQPTGRLTIVTRNKPVKSLKIARGRKAKVCRATAMPVPCPVAREPLRGVAFRDDDQEVVFSRPCLNAPDAMFISLPKGGNASTNTVHSVEIFGDMLMLHLERRVNARSIALTPQGARRLSLDLAQSPGCASPGASCDADALVVQRESDVACSPAIGPMEPRVINLPRGGCAEVSDFSSIEPLGPVLMVHLGRRVNARRIVLTQQSGQKLGMALQTLIAVDDSATPVSGESLATEPMTEAGLTTSPSGFGLSRPAIGGRF